MSIRILSGDGYNVLATGESVSVSPSADSLFPAANVKDGRPDSALRFGTTSTDTTVTVDGNRLRNGTLDTWVGGVPQNWALVAGTTRVTQATSSGEVRSGSAAKISGEGAAGAIRADTTARSDESLVLDAWARVNVPTMLAIVIIQNRLTGRWLDTTSTWTDTFTFCATTDSTDYVNIRQSFDVEGWDECGERDGVTLRVTLLSAASTAADYALFDDVTIYPTVDFASIHGHNIFGNSTVRLRSSNDNFASTSGATNRATFSVGHPAFYAVLSSAVGERYWQVQITPPASVDQDETTWIGEVVIGKARELSRQFNYGSTLDLVQDVIGSRTISGSQHAFRINQRARRVLGMTFDYFTSGEYLEGRRAWERAAGNVNPVVIVPSTCEDVVLHGKLEATFGTTRSLEQHYTDARVIVTEDPFPQWVS